MSSAGIAYFPLTMRSFAPSSNGCCPKQSRYRMQPRACGRWARPAGSDLCPGPSGHGTRLPGTETIPVRAANKLQSFALIKRSFQDAKFLQPSVGIYRPAGCAEGHVAGRLQGRCPRHASLANVSAGDESGGWRGSTASALNPSVSVPATFPPQHQPREHGGEPNPTSVLGEQPILGPDQAKPRRRLQTCLPTPACVRARGSWAGTG